MKICTTCYERLDGEECSACLAERRYAERQRAWWTVDFHQGIGLMGPDEAETYLERVLEQPHRGEA